MNIIAATVAVDFFETFCRWACKISRRNPW